MELCRALPKAELHAHLHGSIRPATLAELMGGGVSAASAALLSTGHKRSLSDCFEIFAMIHAAVTTAASVSRVLSEVVHDFDADNVRLLELRTTPRSIIAHFPLQASLAALLEIDTNLGAYCACLVAALAATEHRCSLRVTTRLLLSVNRTHSLAEAAIIIKLATVMRTLVVPVDVAETWPYFHACSCLSNLSAAAASKAQSYGPYCVGVDLSGDPTRGDLPSFLPVLQTARDAGLKISIHCGETMHVRETEAVLAFRPDRLGHMLLLSPKTFERLVAPLATSDRLPGSESPIPIEVCPTSNSLTLHLPDLGYHPLLSTWLSMGYPFCICTDDSGVFNVTLSGELAAVAATYGLTSAAAASLALRAFYFSFLPSSELGRVIAAAESDTRRLLAVDTADEGAQGKARS